MRRWRLGRNETILIALLVVVHLANGWYGYETWQAREVIQLLEDDLDAEQQNVRRLRLMDQLPEARQELADLQAKAPASIRQPLPSSVDTLQLVSDLTNVLSGSGGRVVNFKAGDPKAETIEGSPFQTMGFELGLLGNPADLLAVLKRVDDSAQVSLRVPTFATNRQNDTWTMKLNLMLYLQPPAQPTPAPGQPAQPSAVPKPAPTPTGKPR